MRGLSAIVLSAATLLGACGDAGGGGGSEDGMDDPECVEGGPFGNVCERPTDPALNQPGAQGPDAGADGAGSDAPVPTMPSMPAMPAQEPGLRPLPIPAAPDCPPLAAADCPDNPFSGDVLARAQADIDALDGVTVIDGDLEVGGEVTDLDALRCLRTIEGDLTIERADALTSFDGLRSLRTIAHSMEVLDNEIADTGCGFVRLEVVGTSSATPAIDFERNPGVTALRLPALTASGHLRIENNDGMIVLEGPDQMESVGQFWIVGHASLSALEGFTGLTSVGDIRISDNPRLSQCQALRILDRLVKAGYQSLAEIGGNLEPCP